MKMIQNDVEPNKFRWTDTANSTWLKSDNSGGCWQLVAFCTRICRKRRRRRGTTYCRGECKRRQKVATSNSWNRQVADKQAGGQNKLLTLSTITYWLL